MYDGGSRPCGDEVVGIPVAQLTDVGACRVHRATRAWWAIERDFVHAGTPGRSRRREYEVRGDAAVVWLDGDERRLAVRTCSGLHNLPALRIPRQLIEDHLTGIELDRAHAKRRARERRLRMAVGHGEHRTLLDRPGDARPTIFILRIVEARAW